jgi:hypothetical protein
LQFQSQIRHPKPGQFLKNGSFTKVIYHFNTPSEIIFPSEAIFPSGVIFPSGAFSCLKSLPQWNFDKAKMATYLKSPIIS